MHLCVEFRLSTSPDRQGLPMNFLYLALYMDASRPMQELPCFEKYRHLAR